jgi:hypothetical protein
MLQTLEVESRDLSKQNYGFFPKNASKHPMFRSAITITENHSRRGNENSHGNELVFSKCKPLPKNPKNDGKTMKI